MDNSKEALQVYGENVIHYVLALIIFIFSSRTLLNEGNYPQNNICDSSNQINHVH